MTSELSAALLKRKPHALDVHSYFADNALERKAARKERNQQSKFFYYEACEAADTPTKCCLHRSKATGSWLTTMPNRLNGTELSAEEFRDSLRLRFGVLPKGLPPRCDGCGHKFSVEHALSCSKGGVVLLRHNEVSEEWQQMCAQAYTPRAVSDEPLIPNSQDPTRECAPQATPIQPESRGDIGCQGFWKRQTLAIFDVRVTNLDGGAQRGKDAATMLAKHELEKKKKHLDRCIAGRCQFTPLVFSCDGMMGIEAEAATKRLASTLSKKWQRSYSQLCAYVRSRLSLALIRGMSLCLRGCRDKNPMLRNPAPQWDSGHGLALY